MGRRNKAYSKDLHQQAYDRLTEMQTFGESKKEAMANGKEKNKIFSFATYKSYWKHIKYFLGYIKEKHPECTTLKSAKKYVNEWLQSRADQGLSAWTVQLEAKALGKLYGISPDDEAYEKMRVEMKQKPEDPFFQGNVALAVQQRLKRNFRSGYWEAMIVHTKPLSVVPPDMRAGRIRQNS